MKIKHFALQSLLFLILLLPAVQAEPLPEIDAREFQSTPVKKSTSGQVYLFRSDGKRLPKTGNIVLLHSDDKPAAAFRVLQTDPVTWTFVAKRVRRYDQPGEFQIDTPYKTYEKVADILPSPPPSQDEAAPSASAPPVGGDAGKITETPDAELDSGAPAKKANKSARAKGEGNLEVFDYDDELDKATSPQNLKKGLEEVDDEEAANIKTEAEISEVTRLSPMRNMLGVAVGYLRNMSGFQMPGSIQNGLMFQYSHVFAQDVLLNPKGSQDDFSIEFGVGYYRSANLTQQNDLYTVTPLTGELRYDVHFSEAFGFFIYGGMQYNMVASAQNTVATTLSQLQGVQQTLGTGLMFNLGPHWYLKMDLGWDRIVGGLFIKW